MSKFNNRSSSEHYVSRTRLLRVFYCVRYVCVKECDRLLVIRDYEAFLIGTQRNDPLYIFPYRRPTLSLYCPDCVQSFGVRRRNKRLSIRV